MLRITTKYHTVGLILQNGTKIYFKILPETSTSIYIEFTLKIVTCTNWRKFI